MLLYLAAAHSFQYRCFPILLPRLPCGPIHCSSLCLVSCSLTCMLTLPPFLIMESVSPKLHLTILACVLVIFILPLPLLRRRSIRLHPTLGLVRQPQTWIMMLKLMFDFSLVVLHALDISNVILLRKGKSR